MYPSLMNFKLMVVFALLTTLLSGGGLAKENKELSRELVAKTFQSKNKNVFTVFVKGLC